MFALDTTLIASVDRINYVPLYKLRLLLITHIDFYKFLEAQKQGIQYSNSVIFRHDNYNMRQTKSIHGVKE